MNNENRGLDRLEGLVPVIEDRHSKVRFLKSIWKILYNTSSGVNSGTLFQLRNLLQRRTVTKQVKSDPTACEDFFLLIVNAHILHLVMKIWKLESLDADPPNDSVFGDKFRESNSSEKTNTFLKAVEEIVEMYTHKFEVQVKWTNLKESDRVIAYAKELLSLGLLYMKYVHSVCKGDGHRILRSWRFLLLIFNGTGKRKYSIQAATFLFQYHYLFTERMKHQLLWCSTVNVHGKQGKNIAIDLYMEHLNRELKSCVSNLGANKTENTIKRLGLCLRQLIAIRTNYDSVSGIPVESGWHKSWSMKKDLTVAMKELEKAEVYEEKSKRKHSEFKAFKCNQDMVKYPIANTYQTITSMNVS